MWRWTRDVGSTEVLRARITEVQRHNHLPSVRSHRYGQRRGIDAKITVAVFALLAPYPGTPLYQRFKAAGRITRDGWWLSDDHDTDAPLYRPTAMSREALRAGWVRAWRAMYSWSSIQRRYGFGRQHSWVQNVAYWPLNLVMHEVAEKKIAGGDRAWRKHRTLDLPLGF